MILPTIKNKKFASVEGVRILLQATYCRTLIYELSYFISD